MQDQNNAGGDEQLTVVPSRSELVAWAAGLFEGEGTWNAYQQSKGNNTMQVQMRLAMSDRDVVERFAAILGFGQIRERKAPVEDHWKPIFEWYAYRRGHIRSAIEMFWPYLGDRRRERASEIWALGEAIHAGDKTHCPNGHPYSGDNLVLELIKRGGKSYYARRCKICRTEQARERARKRRGVKPENFRV